MSDENPRVAIGDNQPPAPTPLEAMTAHIEDLFETAQGFLDGEPIANQETADLVNKLKRDALTALKDAEAARTAEKKPHDDAAKAVQARWLPLTHEKTGRCALIVATANKALTPWLEAVADQQRAEADAVRQRAADAQKLAQEALAASRGDDLAARGQAETLLAEAGKLSKAANRLDKAKAHAGGGDDRATGLRTSWKGAVTDFIAFSRWAWVHRREEYEAFLSDLAEREGRRGPVSIPGMVANPERKAA